MWFINLPDKVFLICSIWILLMKIDYYGNDIGYYSIVSRNRVIMLLFHHLLFVDDHR